MQVLRLRRCAAPLRMTSSLKGNEEPKIGGNRRTETPSGRHFKKHSSGCVERRDGRSSYG